MEDSEFNSLKREATLLSAKRKKLVKGSPEWNTAAARFQDLEKRIIAEDQRRDQEKNSPQ
jgi:hypothetical protein